MTRHRSPRTTLLLLLAPAMLVACSAAPLGTPSERPSAAPSATPSTQPSSASPTAATGLPSPSPSASPSPATVGDARRADLAFLVSELKRIHPNPFLDEGEAAFIARVRAIGERADEMTDVQFLVAVVRLMGARDRDGHSGAWAMAQPGTLLHAWPIWLWWFPDGLRVVAAKAPVADLVGARLTRVGHATLDEAVAAVRPLVPRDNASNERANLPIYLTLPEVATDLGLLAPGDPALTFELENGATREVNPAPEPIDAMRDWIFGVYGGQYPDGLPPAKDGPRWLRPTEDAFWAETIAEPKALYIGYRVIDSMGAGGLTMSGLADQVRAAAAADPDIRVVVDLRRNGGGDNTTYAAFRIALAEAATAHPGSVRIIAGPATFSAAGNFVTELKVGPGGDGVRLVGEPPGGGLDMYGDVRVVTLPSSHLVVLVSSRYHQKAPGDDRLQIEPDVRVELPWADYAAGRDPVLEAALAD